MTLTSDVPPPGLRTFLIADVRGYTRFTAEHGDDAAAHLAAMFAAFARDAVEARGGRVVELRGDEVLAVFDAAAQAIRAALELQRTLAEEVAADPSIPLLVGIGVAAGEAVPVEDGFRGAALNLAARLCSTAAAGEVLVSEWVAGLAGTITEMSFEDRGSVELKGFPDAVPYLEAVSERVPSPLSPSGTVAPGDVAAELDARIPLIGREHEMRWTRGTWRQVRRAKGRVLVISGPSGIGKTRFAAEMAAYVETRGGEVRYAGAGGTAIADILGSIVAARAATRPTLCILDDLDAAGEQAAAALAHALEDLQQRPVLVLAVAQRTDVSASLEALVGVIDVRGDGHRVLGPLNLDGVRDICRIYAGVDVEEAPIESIARSSGGIPGQVHEVVSGWAQEEAARRLEAAAQWFTTGRERRSAGLGFANNVIGLKLDRIYGLPDVGEESVCPYMGLASFGEQDARYFFGRESLVGELAARSVGVGLLGVVGASGSGKSSVVAAGLRSSLGAGLLPGSANWRQVSLRPGEHPMAELTAALGTDAPRAEDGDPIGRTIDALGPNERLVLYVDQFEEIFTTCMDTDEAATFVHGLLRASAAPERAVVVVCLRGDFYAHTAAYPVLAETLSTNHVIVGAMSPEELRRAIELPARRAGLRVESALVGRLVEEVSRAPGGLPLLSTALVELWEQRTGGWIRLDAYERTGGLNGAVARLADQTYDQLSEAEKAATPAVFLRLVGPGEGDAITRRRVPLDEFDIHTDRATDEVVRRFTQDRLLSADDRTVEVAHEALLREWPRLQTWLTEDVQGRELRAHLTGAARTWQDAGEEDSELYRGARLSATLDWASTHDEQLNDLERSFLTSSRRAGERDVERQRRTNRRLRGLLVGVGLFLVVALVAGSLALVQRGRARHSETVALSQSLGAKGVVEPQLDTALLLAEEGMRLDDSDQTRSDLFTALLHSPAAIHVLHVGTIGASPQSLAVSPDGRTLAIVNGDRSLVFYDTSTGRPIGEPVSDVAATGYRLPQFTRDGSKLAVLRGRAVQMVDVRTHKVAQAIKVGRSVDDFYSPVLLSPDGGFAYLQIDEGVEAFDTSRGGRVARVDVPGLSCQGLAVAQRTGEVVTLTPRGGGRIDIRDGDTLAVESSFEVPVPLPRSLQICGQYTLAVSPDGRTAVYAMSNVGGDESLRFVDLRTGDVRVGVGALAGGDFVALSPDGRTAMSVSDDYLDISVWDVATATILQTLRGHSGAVESAVFDPSGQLLYSAGDDGNVFVWDISGRRSLGRSFTAGPGSFSNWLAYPNVSSSPDGKSIAVPFAHYLADGTNGGGGVVIVDLATGRVTRRVAVEGRGSEASSVSYAEFSPDGSDLLVSPGPTSDGDITLWGIAAGPPRLIRTFSGLSAKLAAGFGDFQSAPSATFSPDGAWIAGVDRRAHGVAHVVEWNADTGAARAAPLTLRWKETEGHVSQNVVYSPDGSLIATSVLGDQILIVDANTLRPVRTIPDPQGVAVVAFSPTDGSVLAEGVSDVGLVRLWDVATGRKIGEVAASPSTLGGLWSVAFDPTGSMLVTVGSDGGARLWSVPGLEKIGTSLPGATSRLGVAAFAGKESSALAVLVYTNGQAFAYHASPEWWEQQACLVAGRNFTQAEWGRYLPGRPYSNVCPDV
jgi:WD40 repeat protein/class 3 adenylate cyclase